MTAPSNYIDSNYQSVVVVTHGGRVITGVQVNEDNFSIQLREQQMGKFYSFFKRDLEMVSKQKKSIMPENLTEQITPQELHDVFSYLITLERRRSASKRVPTAEKSADQETARQETVHQETKDT